MKYKYKDTQEYVECPECLQDTPLEDDKTCGTVDCADCGTTVCLLSEVDAEPEDGDDEPDDADFVSGRGGWGAY